MTRDVGPNQEEEAGSDGRIRAAIAAVARFDALLLTAGIWFLAKFLRYAFPPLFEQLQSVYAVSTGDLGAAFTGFMLVYAAMQFPSGVVADRIGAVPVITAGAVVAALGAIAVVVGDTVAAPLELLGPFAVLVAAMLVMGAGTGAHKTVAIDLLSRTYPSRTGRALGVLDTVGTFGGVVAPLAVAAVLGTDLVGADWRTLFAVSGVVGLALAALFAIRVRGRATSGEGAVPSLSARAYVVPFLSPRLATFVVVTLGFSFAYNGIVAFLPLYLSRDLGLGPATASVLYSAFFVVSAIQLASGEVSDRIGRLPVIAGALALATGTMAALIVQSGDSGSVVVAGVAVVGLGAGSHAFRPVRGAHLTALLPDEVAGGGLGVVRTGLMGAGAVAPAVVGAIGERTESLVPPFFLLLATLALSAVLAIALLLTDR